MKRFKVMGLCLVAVLALSAMVVASASAALPEYKACVKVAKNGVTKKYEGKYSVKTCATEASPTEQSEGKKNKYEREEYNKGKSATPTFKGKNVGTPKNLIVDPTCPEGKFNNGTHKCEEPGKAKGSEKAQIGGVTECGKEAVLGTITGPKTTQWKTTYSKCKALETPCNTAGEKSGVIVTDQLEATLVYLNSAKTEPGIQVHGNGEKGRLAQYECLAGALKVQVFGQVLAKQSGNTNSAEGKTTNKVGQGPLVLQSNLYLEEAHSEEFGKETFTWGFNFKKCVETKVGEQIAKKEAPNVPAAEAACFGELGPYPGYPAPLSLPVMLESETTLGAGPAVQNGETANKGEKEILIEA